MKKNILNYIRQYKFIILFYFILSIIFFFLIKNLVDNRVKKILDENSQIYETTFVVDILYNKKLLYYDVQKIINQLQIKLLLKDQLQNALQQLASISKDPSTELIDNFKIDFTKYSSINLDKNIHDNFYAGGYSEYYEDEKVEDFYNENIIIEDKYENSIVFKIYNQEIKQSVKQIESLVKNFNIFIKKDNVEYINKITNVYSSMQDMLENKVKNRARKYSDVLDHFNIDFNNISENELKKISIIFNEGLGYVVQDYLTSEKELDEIRKYFDDFKLSVNYYNIIYGQKDVVSLRNFVSKNVTVSQFDQKSLKFNLYVLNFVIFIILLIVTIYIREILKKNN